MSRLKFTGKLPAAVVALISFFSAAALVRADDVAAISARDFLDSIGVCTHIGQGADDPVKSAEALKYAGIRNVRDDASTRHLRDWILLHKQTGVKVVLTQSGPADSSIPRILGMSRQLAEVGALLALEGPNEPNNWAVTWQGQKSGSSFMPVAQWQAAFYAAAKKDGVLRKYPVFASSEAGGSEPDNVGLQFLVIPKGADTLMPRGTRFGDYANVHNYLCRKPGIIDNMAWVNADPTFHGWTDGIDVEYGKTWRKGFVGYSDDDLANLPRVTTETGWVTGGPRGLTEEQQAHLYLNLYLSQFRRGFRYTFVYMLRDGGGGDDAGYGMFLHDYQPKRSATCLHNLTAILADSGNRQPGRLSYAIPGAPPTVHDLLLQKGNGVFELVVWDEKARGSDSTTVLTEREMASVRIYDPTLGDSPARTLNRVRGVTLTLSDHPLVLEMVPSR